SDIESEEEEEQGSDADEERERDRLPGGLVGELDRLGRDVLVADLVGILLERRLEAAEDAVVDALRLTPLEEPALLDLHCSFGVFGGRLLAQCWFASPGVEGRASSGYSPPSEASRRIGRVSALTSGIGIDARSFRSFPWADQPLSQNRHDLLRIPARRLRLGDEGRAVERPGVVVELDRDAGLEHGRGVADALVAERVELHGRDEIGRAHV